ncbi:alpha-globin transcription factor CP2-like [Tachypleus tridentatus]|uniref:alpha-globin transcription factor CP2-like n=1 Tax=Tachypleus tridentatus TaxID=6853 RepID=UPI003FD1F27D
MSGHWNVDSIGDALAADFDGSLSGLGMELGTGSFNMSDTLMALPTLNSLKQEKEARSSSVPDLHVSSITHVFQLSSDSVFSFHCQNVSTQQNNSSVTPHGFHNAEFQYILGAATALGTRKHDETMTYLNQGI